MVEIKRDSKNYRGYMSITLHDLIRKTNKEVLVPGIGNIENIRNTCDEFKYVDLRVHARRLNRILNKPEIRDLYHYTSSAYAMIRRFKLIEDSDYETWYEKWSPKPEGELLLPSDVDSCDWRWNAPPGRPPKYWDFVCHGSCHWMVEANLQVAKRLLPEYNWIILSGELHSTVVAPEAKLIFDMQYSALQVSERTGLEMIFGESLDDFSDIDVGCDAYPYSCREGLFGYVEEIITLIERHFPGEEQKALTHLAPMMRGEQDFPEMNLRDHIKQQEQEAVAA